MESINKSVKILMPKKTAISNYRPNGTNETGGSKVIKHQRSSVGTKVSTYTAAQVALELCKGTISKDSFIENLNFAIESLWIANQRLDELQEPETE